MSANKKILVADHSLVARRLMNMILREAGYQVSSVPLACDCLTHAIQERPDLIILHGSLPDMGGMEVCQALWAEPKTWEIPVLITGTDLPALRLLCQHLDNVVDILEKPFTSSSLQTAVHRALHLDEAIANSARCLTPSSILTS